MNEKYIYCDLDGVLADFDAAIETKIGLGLSDDDMWATIHRDFPNWFADLPLTSHAERLWNYINKIAPVAILTAIPKADRGIQGVAGQKLAWVRRHFSVDVPVITCYGVDKKDYCVYPTDILIDDTGRNIGQWIKAGGIGILHSSVSQTINVLKELE